MSGQTPARRRIIFRDDAHLLDIDLRQEPGLPSSAIISRRERLIEAEVDGELLGLHIEKGTCYGFNGTATRIWAHLASPLGFDELCERLTSEFRLARPDCERDVQALLAELQADGLVEIEGELPKSA